MMHYKGIATKKKWKKRSSKKMGWVCKEAAMLSLTIRVKF